MGGLLTTEEDQRRQWQSEHATQLQVTRALPEYLERRRERAAAEFRGRAGRLDLVAVAREHGVEGEFVDAERVVEVGCEECWVQLWNMATRECSLWALRAEEARTQRLVLRALAVADDVKRARREQRRQWQREHAERLQVTQVLAEHFHRLWQREHAEKLQVTQALPEHCRRRERAAELRGKIEKRMKALVLCGLAEAVAERKHKEHRAEVARRAELERQAERERERQAELERQREQRRTKGNVWPSVCKLTERITEFAPIYLEGKDTKVTLQLPGRDEVLRASVQAGCTLASKLLTAFTEPVGDDACGPGFSLSFDDGSQSLLPVVVELKVSAATVLGKRVNLCDERGEVIEEAYFSVEDPSIVIASTSHFSEFSFRLASIDCKVRGIDVRENDRFSRPYDDWGEARREYRHGDMPYYLPFKFRRTALDIGCKDGLGDFEDAVVGFHGTTLEHAKNILDRGFQIPSRRGVVPSPSHIPLEKSVFRISRWADAIFFSPSYKYCMAPGYAGNEKTLTTYDGRLFAATGQYIEQKVMFVIIQCRIKKEALTVNPATGKCVFPGTTGSWNGSDSRISKEEMEYRVVDVSGIKPYGLLFRSEPLGEISSFDNPGKM